MVEAGAYFFILFMAGADGLVPIVPGESTVIAGAVLASAGHLSIYLVVLSGALGATIGDSLAYWIGAAGGQGRVKMWMVRKLGEERILAAEDLLQRRAAVLIIFGRFVPGVRVLVSVSAGMLGMRYRRFLPWSLLAGFLWATYAGALGYFIGEAVDNLWVSLVASVAAASLISFVLVALERHRLRALIKPR